MSDTPDSPATRSRLADAEREQRRADRAQRPGRIQRGGHIVAIGFMQLAALVGVVGLAVILGAVLVSDANEAGWITGLVIGLVSVVLTILVLLSGRHVRRH
ncbi:MAG TPA: hypothetical protein VFB39_07925 [Solirubrobacteraceae bacterium]|nr:hypothetical protein [Solirubrobacteraceae bacterium]